MKIVWTPELIAQLTELWASGAPAEEIGRIMGGLGKNSILGKVHRLGLPERPHHGGRPISTPLVPEKRDEVIAMLKTGRGATSTARLLGVKEYSVRLILGEMQRAGVERAPPSTKPIVFPVTEATMIRSVQQNAFELIVIPRPIPAPVLPKWVSMPIPPARVCQWVEEGPKRRTWIYCEDPVVARGNPYCACHAERAFVSQEQAA